jgi:hypothetical protein
VQDILLPKETPLVEMSWTVDSPSTGPAHFIFRRKYMNTFREKFITFSRIAGDTLAVLFIFAMGYGAFVVF